MLYFGCPVLPSYWHIKHGISCNWYCIRFEKISGWYSHNSVYKPQKVSMTKSDESSRTVSFQVRNIRCYTFGVLIEEFFCAQKQWGKT